MRPMKERNQVTVGVVGTVIAALVVLLALNLSNLPFVNSQKGYHAQLVAAAGLSTGDDVRVRGIPVGKVDNIVVERDHVRVDFSIKSDLRLGAHSRASVEVATVLGSAFLQIETAGPGILREGGTIPVSRTSVPYNLVSAFQQFAKFGNAVDKQQLTESLTTLARSVSSISPAMARKAVQGLASMATTLAAKQQQVSEILTSANRITNTLNSNSTALTQLLLDGDAFLQLVQQRHDLIVELLRDTAKLGAQLDALVRTNGAHLSGLIANLDSVSALLEREKAQLQQAVVVLGQFSVNIANVTGAGPWLDLLLPNSAIPDNMIKACGAHPDASKRPCGD